MVALTQWPHFRTHRLTQVPVVTLMPHSRCNCRCVMCDIWKANRSGTSLGEETVRILCGDLKTLGTCWVVLSGGEALMHANLWRLCEALRAVPVKITLLSSGLLLERHAESIVRWCDDVIVSLDGTEATHNRIRGVENAYASLARGIASLRANRRDFPVSARCVVQRRNFRELPEIVAAARQIGCDRISFLAADLTTQAFNRPTVWAQPRVDDVGLSLEESGEFEILLDEMIARCRDDFAMGFIAESPKRLRRIARYFRATHGAVPFPETVCNAPWVSAVVEADGAVRPCFFHPAQGNIHEAGLPEILNSERAIAFRKSLDVRRDPVCSRCVCTLNL